ncbi:MAG TPA: hypothetical protein V6D08_18350, partial [Candidatus Obscuribacterales bacterium]
EKRARFARLADCLESYAQFLKALNRGDEANRIANKAKIYAGFAHPPPGGCQAVSRFARSGIRAVG